MMRAHSTKIFRVVAVIGLTLIVGAARGQGAWDWLKESLKDDQELRALCAQNPRHERCQPPTASTVLTWCESADPYNRGRCHGQLTGIARDGARLTEWLCVPRAVIGNADQLQRLFVREGQRMPEILHQPAERLLFYAVAKAFPCPLRGR